MKVKSPPDFKELLDLEPEDLKTTLVEILTEDNIKKFEKDYLHWDKLRFKKSIDISPERDWLKTKILRSVNYRQLPFSDKIGDPFHYYYPDCILKELSIINSFCTGKKYEGEESIHKEYFIRELFEESIRSSQLEGASTTRRKAKEMLQQMRLPKDKDERMIFNNYKAMMFVKDHREVEFSIRLICDIHKIISSGTLENDSHEGCFRESDDILVQNNSDGSVLHAPPKAAELKQRLELICKFANNPSSDTHFLHPVVKAIIIHFMISYEHPFVDGNGRTARALFYLYMLKHGYSIMEYASISMILKSAPAGYRDAFLFTETDDNDLNYFILHQLKTIRKSLEALERYINSKREKMGRLLDFIGENSSLKHRLNRRQLALLDHAIKNPRYFYNIAEHKNYYNVTYETARKDLMELSDVLGLFDKTKSGGKFIFLSPADLGDRLQSFNKREGE